MSERNQDTRISAALELAEKIVHPSALNFKKHSSGAERLLAQAVLDLHQRLRTAGYAEEKMRND